MITDYPSSVDRALLGGIRVVAFVGYLILAIPSLLVIPISFSGGLSSSWSLDNLTLDLYRQMFAAPEWIAAISLSAQIAALTTITASLVGIPAAYALHKSEFPGKAFLQFVLLSPMFIPSIVMALGFYLYFAPFRLVNTVPGLVAAHTVLTIPYVVTAVMGALRRTDPRLEMAAAVLGASSMRILRQVVIPQIRASIAAAMVFSFMISFDEVTIAWFISGSNTATLPVTMYRSIQFEISPVIAAVSTILTAMSFVACLITLGIQSYGVKSSEK